MIIRCAPPSSKNKKKKVWKKKVRQEKKRRITDDTFMPNVPSWQEFSSYGIALGMSTQKVRKAYLHYQDLGWITIKGHMVTDWKKSLKGWI